MRVHVGSALGLRGLELGLQGFKDTNMLVSFMRNVPVWGHTKCEPVCVLVEYRFKRLYLILVFNEKFKSLQSV